MTTATKKPQFKQPQDFAELAEMEEKVRASRTYQHSYYVMRETRYGSLSKGYTTKYLLSIQGITKKEAEECAAGLNKLAANYKTKEIDCIRFEVGNIFEGYRDYINKGGTENPKAATWDLIKWTTYGIVHNDPKDWD